MTTEWVVVFGLPIFPLCSLRVKEGKYHSESFLRSRQEYTVHQELSLNLKQVACVYVFTLFYLTWIASVLLLVSIPGLAKSEALGVLLLMGVGFCLPLAIPGLLRRRSKRKAGIAFVPPPRREILEWWGRATWKERAAVLLPLIGMVVVVIAGFLLGVCT